MWHRKGCRASREGCGTTGRDVGPLGGMQGHGGCCMEKNLGVQGDAARDGKGI